MSASAEPPAAAETAHTENLGARLREARLRASLSLREVARQLGVSASFVSQLENGKSQPSVATLFSLGRLLGVSIDRLFEDDAAPLLPVQPPPPTSPAPPLSHSSASGETTASGEAAHAGPDRRAPSTDSRGEHSLDALRFSVTKPGARRRLVLESGVVWEQLVRKSDDLDFIELVYPAGSSSTTDGRMLRHDDYEYGLLLEGELEVTLGFDVFLLHAGEAIGFDSTIPHLFRNPGTTPARGIWVMHHRQQ